MSRRARLQARSWRATGSTAPGEPSPRPTATTAALVLSSGSRTHAAEARSFRFEDGRPDTITIGRYVGGGPGGVGPTSTPIACTARTHEVRLPEARGQVRVYCSFDMGDSNPAPFEEGQPTAYQTVTVGQTSNGAFVPTLRFGIVDDDRASPGGRASYVAGAYDGKIEYFGMYARPRTTSDFTVELDPVKGRAMVWVSGRGDDEWFPLAADAGLMGAVTAIDTVRVEQLPKAAGIHDLVIGSDVWPEGEAIRPHPLAKKGGVLTPGNGVRFQPMRSLWKDAARHVTVARRPNSPEGWWLGFPDVVQTGPTTLVANYVDGAGHGGFGRWWVARSDDLGKTWKDVATIGRGGACMRLQKLRDGSLLMSEPAFFRSVDGGGTWERIGEMNPTAAGGHGAGVASRIVEMDDGSWLLGGSYTVGEPWKLKEGEALELYLSEDRGKTWRLHSTIKPPYPLSISEPSLVPLPDGRMVLYARNQLVEQQLVSKDLLDELAACSPPRKASPPAETDDRVVERNLGGFAGHGDISVLPDTWIMHCCTANATQALYYAWEGIVREHGQHQTCDPQQSQHGWHRLVP